MHADGTRCCISMRAGQRVLYSTKALRTRLGIRERNTIGVVVTALIDAMPWIVML
jgi:hypothetical protein